MLKQLLIFGVIFLCGVLSYPFLKDFIQPYLEKKEVPNTTQTEEIKEEQVATTSVAEKVEEKKPVIIDEAGGLHDGPFVVSDRDGKDTGARAKVIYSPEETLIEFVDASFRHSAGTLLHLAKDVKGKEYLNLGSARINSGVLVYGLPLDLDITVFTHLLFYNPDTNVIEYSVSFE